MNKLNLNAPTYYSGYFLGVIASDGSVWNDGYRIGFQATDSEYTKAYREAIEISFGLTPRITTMNRKTVSGKQVYRVQVTCKDLWNYTIDRFGGLAKTRSLSWMVPELKSYDEKLGFIAGLLDGDGSINLKAHSIYFAIYSEEARNQMTALISELGFRSSICRNMLFVLGTKHEKQEFLNMIRPKIPRKQEVI